jgi:acid stress chaperone HdeB
MGFRRIALVAAALALASPAVAEKIDLSTIKCSDFVTKDKEEIGYILAWLDAYYKEEDDPAIIDTDKFVANAKKLGDYCRANPTLGLITATDKLFGK